MVANRVIDRNSAEYITGRYDEDLVHRSRQRVEWRILVVLHVIIGLTYAVTLRVLEHRVREEERARCHCAAPR